MNDLRKKMQLIWGITIVTILCILVFDLLLAELFPYGWLVPLLPLAVDMICCIRYLRCPYCDGRLRLTNHPFCPHCGKRILD